MAYITTEQFQTEIDQDDHDLTEQLHDLLGYIQTIDKKHFHVNIRQGEHLADLFCQIDEDKYSEQFLDLNEIISEKKNNRRLTKNILTEAQILEAFENLVELNLKFQIHNNNSEFDLYETLKKLSRRAKVVLENRQKDAAQHQDDENGSIHYQSSDNSESDEEMIRKEASGV